MPSKSVPSSATFSVHPFPGLGIIKKGDDVGLQICQTCRETKFNLCEGDVLVVAQTVVSRAEGRIVVLSSVVPSHRARRLAAKLGKPANLVEVILRASKRILRAEKGHLITETPHGFVCANSGVDSSNVPEPDSVTLLPENPDASAERIRQTIKERLKVNVGIIISDTHGRPFREGAINVAIGVAGLLPMKVYIGLTDLFGYVLRSTKVAIADELASAAELVMGEADEGNAVVVIRGYRFEPGEGSGQTLVRDPRRDLFRR
ncbi:MAG: coenzyme F420-0:L-glutamate ligase [Candidatus Hermodarchaeota archaeon]|nr:coenzyme F420-0:L-glutamate ligase [Candidatus Hermodarchaeota archaeon]